MASASEGSLTRYLGPLELRIIESIWENGPSKVGELQERLNAETRQQLAYNTVMATVTRLYDKGYVTRERVGKAYVYATDGGPDEFLKARATETVLDLIDDFGSLAAAGIMDGVKTSDETRALLDEIIKNS